MASIESTPLNGFKLIISQKGRKSRVKIEKRPLSRALFYLAYARVTLPERRQREQTATVVGVPSTIAFTLRILGFQERLVLRWEWETF
jgi:hypothetical protein